MLKWPAVRALGLALLASSAALAQQKTLSLAAIYDPAARVDFSGSAPIGLQWIDEARYAHYQSTASGSMWMAVEAASGREEPLFDPARMEMALARLPDVDGNAAREAARSRALTFDRGFTAALFTIDADLFTYALDADRAARLTSSPAPEELASFSPDGTRVAFVRDHNLHVVEIATLRETALTSDGSAKVLNGKLDWVYEEEIYGRGERQAYWWSPDSARLAFLRIDDTPVPTYITVDDIPYDQVVERWDYPKAGDPNPLVTLGVAPAGGGSVQWMDLEKHPATDRLIVDVSWTPDGHTLVYQVQNRVQSWLELNTASASTGDGRTLLRETGRPFLDPGDYEAPIWLKDGSFLWVTPHAGWRHVYHHRADGSLLRPVTTGRWEVRAVHGFDEARGWLYFSGTERSHIGGDVYRVRLDGSGLERLSRAEGRHAARFSPAFGYFIDSWSAVATPVQVRLHRGDGREVRVIVANPVAALAEYRLSVPEFLQVMTRDGFPMEAMILKPPDFDPARRYPVLQFIYGGPHAPRVTNSWGGMEYLFHQLLAAHGIIVWICDNRTASGKGLESAWPVYGRMGEVELLDIEDGVAWLKRQPYVDGTRIGLYGWSYGGYMTAYALTHSTSFAMGIAGGTVADWRGYDTVYTERYMGLPEENAEAYRRSSPRSAARDLHGALLLVHGTIDDNVHVSNTMQLAYELQRAQKPFELMLYPRSRHSISDSHQNLHLRTLMLDFVVRYLRPSDTAGPSERPLPTSR